MTLPVIDLQPLVSAVKAAMQDEGIAYDEGRKPSGVTTGRPYVVGWFDQGLITDRSLRSRDGLVVVLVLQSYGFSPDSVRVAVRRSRVALAGLIGDTVGAFVLLPPEHRPGPPMQRDDAADPPLWWQSDEWLLRTSPA